MRKFAVNLLLVALPAFADNSVTVGMDSWTNHDQARYLPSYSQNDWHQNNLFIKANGSYQSGDARYSYAYRNDQVNGATLDRLDIDYRLADSTGVRVGVLPYRTSWCRTYEQNNPFIAEPDAFCRFSGLNEISRGAFGTQAYHSFIGESWIVDTMVGVYRPNVDGQNKTLGPYVPVGANTVHKAHGAAINALSLETGLNARFGWLNTEQIQVDQTGAKKPYDRRLTYDTYYFGLERGIIENLELRATVAAYIGDQNNPANLYHWDGQSKTIEAIYSLTQNQTLAFGLSEYVNKTTYGAEPLKQRLIVKSQTIAWRINLPDNWHLTAQYLKTNDDYKTRSLIQTVRTGDTFGLQLAKTFN